MFRKTLSKRLYFTAFQSQILNISESCFQNQLRRILPIYAVNQRDTLCFVPQRFYSETQIKPKAEQIIVDYDYVKNATTNDNILIVDVRGPDEIIENGKIPNSINIPVADVPDVLNNMTDSEFQKKYNKPKPKQDTEIIFYCKIGRRAGTAQQNALDLGYKNVKNYLGSWTDWATKIQ